MNAEQYLNEALGGNMNVCTLKPLAWYEIMEGYARHKLSEAQAASTNTQRDAICPHVKSVCSHDGDDCTGIVGAWRISYNVPQTGAVCPLLPILTCLWKLGI